MQSSAKLRRLKQDYESAQQQWQASVQMQKDAEWTLEEISQRLQKREQRLFEGNSSNTKELQSLQQEVQRLRAQQGKQEEQVLHAIDATESLYEVVERKQAELNRAEESWQEEVAGLVARRSQIEGQQQKQRDQRQSLVGDLEADLLKRYEAMRKGKQGRAISKIDHNSCQWCRVILTPSELQHVRTGTTLQTCTNCGRILYYDR
jgi:predicted  nucleic acid-binding Zn-ribbon protein